MNVRPTAFVPHSRPFAVRFRIERMKRERGNEGKLSRFFVRRRLEGK